MSPKQGSFYQDWDRPALRLGPDFNGAVYSPDHDHARLTGQLRRVWVVMSEGAWLTLEELAEKAQAPAASASAQLRHLKKPRFGGFTIEKRPRGDRSHGLWEYRLVR